MGKSVFTDLVTLSLHSNFDGIIQWKILVQNAFFRSKSMECYVISDVFSRKTAVKLYYDEYNEIYDMLQTVVIVKKSNVTRKRKDKYNYKLKFRICCVEGVFAVDV